MWRRPSFPLPGLFFFATKGALEQVFEQLSYQDCNLDVTLELVEWPPVEKLLLEILLVNYAPISPKDVREAFRHVVMVTADRIAVAIAFVQIGGWLAAFVV